MKQDYLWDKSGDDAEIKGLEEVLATFRYQETAAPPIHVAEPVPVVRQEPRWRFSFAFAFAGTAVMLVILFGIWLQFPGGQRESKSEVATVTQPETAPQKDESTPYSTTSEVNVDKVENKAVTPVPAIAILPRSTGKMAKENLVAARVQSRKSRPVKLTNEEKFAYGQLMLALSITGSKLKMVRDTVNGED